MSWFSGTSVPIGDLELKIGEATSESIPNGDIDLVIALEITDLIRSKKIPPKQCMRALKKRLTLTSSNPNLVKLTLQLVDLCVKNGGFHFLIEVLSKEFTDYLVDTLFKLHYDVKLNKIRDSPAKFEVGQYILQLIKNWTVYFKGQLQLGNVEKLYRQLLSQGYQFPESDSPDDHIQSQFVDLEVPPDWVDADECMICYNAFSVLNRKHHCRSCGGVFCGEHSAKSIPLVHLGIMEAVRVCDNCYEKVKLRGGGRIDKVLQSTDTGPGPGGEDEDEELRKAIELSLKESQIPLSRPVVAPRVVEPPTTTNEESDDEDMKAAIAASLQEFKAKESLYQQQLAPPEPQDDFYGNLLPQSYQQPQPQQQQQQQ